MSRVSSKLKVSRVSWNWMIAAGLAAALAACATEPTPEGTSVVQLLTANSLTPSELFNGQLTTTQLDATSAAAMGATDDARRTLSYAVNCALSSSQSVSFTVDGTAYTYVGEIGLQPAWTTGALSASDAAWISACVFSRVNLTGTVVSISERGGQPALATTPAEVANWDLEEGAFWGNAFVDLGAIAAFACDGVDQSTDDARGDLPVRQCAQPDGVAGSTTSPCGFSYAGPCTAVCSSADLYSGCSFQVGAASANVITTFVLGAP